MDDFTKHPFTQTWWRRGVIPGIKYLHRAGMLELAGREFGVLAMAIEIGLTKARLDDKYHEFLLDIEKDENSKELKNQLTAKLGYTLAEAMQVAKIHPEDLLDEDEMEKHAKKCKDPNCPVKKIIKVANEVAASGLNLTKSRAER